MTRGPSLETRGFLLLSACLTIMVGCVIVPGLPATTAGLHLGAESADWLVTLPSLGVIIGSPLAGWLIGRAGAYDTLAGGLFFYGLLGAAGPLLAGMGAQLIYLDRVALGIATASVMASGTTLIALFWQDPSARLRMIAAQGMSIELGGVVFLAVGGWLASLRWSYPFLLYLVAWFLLVFQLVKVPRPQTPGEGPRSTGKDGLPWSVLATATASLVVFFTGVLKLPASLVALGLNSAGAGLFLAFVSLIAVCAASQLPRLTRRIGSSGAFIVAFACYAAAFVIFAAQPALVFDIVGAVLMGSGFGLSVPLVNHCVIEQSAPALLGKALAALSLALFLGQFLASFSAALPGSSAMPFLAAATVAVLAALPRLVVLRRRARS